VLEQIYGSSNSKKLSSSASENISSSFTHCDQDQEEQSSVQKELNSASLRKPEGPILTEQKKNLSEKDDCSTSSSDIDDDDTNDEYDEQELLMEFKKLISKHIKL
jgi:hypothetical protein